MKHIKFNKAICGVDLLLNVLRFQDEPWMQLTKGIQSADFFQIVFIKSVRGNILIDGQQIQLGSNSLVFISANQKYKWNVESDSFDATFLIFQEEFLNEFFSDKYFTYRLLYFYQKQYPLGFQCTHDIEPEFLLKLHEMKEELKFPKTDSVHLIRSILYYVLIKLNRIYSAQFGIQSAISKDNLAYKFRKLVEKHISTKHRIDDYTQLLNISRITLNSAVKKQFNSTASEFIKSRLAYEIKMELIYTNKTVEEISIAFNFPEANHLTRFFKTQTGTTPSQYRLDYQNGSNNV